MAWVMALMNCNLFSFYKAAKFMNKVLLVSALMLASFLTYAQVTPCNCTASVGSGTVNFSTLTWTHDSGPACPSSGATSYSGNLCVTLANGANLNMDKDFMIGGGFGISNSGSSTFTIPSGRSLTVSGNMGDDANNNVTFVIKGNLTVGGTLYGKNSNAFQGSGSVTASGLDFFHEPTCSPCDITWNVGSCKPTSTTFCTIVMPVTLIYFKAEVEDERVLLSWATATELNFDRFIIEKTYDGKNFVEIGTRPGAGTSVGKREYSFEDPAPTIGRSYYRLKALDFDNSYEYFGLVTVDYNGSKSIVIYPNPSSDDYIKVLSNFSPGEDKHRIEILDNLGVKLKDLPVSDMETQIAFNGLLKQGSYLLRYVSKEHTQVVRFFVK
jgi:hypothetical protein